MKKLLLILTLSILACNLPIQISMDEPAPTPTYSPPTPTPLPAPEIGTEKNPLILALAPSAQPNPEIEKAGEEIAAFIEQRTGYRLVTIAPASETNLVDALDKGNAHIARLSPFGYIAARENNSVTALLATTRNGQVFYGAQFIANRESEFVTYFDSARGANFAEARDALKQFQNKKPCWSDPFSPSGYAIPLGALKQADVETREGAFLQGHAGVVRAVYAGDICNFGATYIDARALPALEANYPDVSERVIVVWRIPEIIPYDNISASNELSLEMRRTIQRAFVDLILTPDGKLLLQKVYGIDEFQVADYRMYLEFERYWEDSGVDIFTLIE